MYRLEFNFDRLDSRLEKDYGIMIDMSNALKDGDIEKVKSGLSEITWNMRNTLEWIQNWRELQTWDENGSDEEED